MFEKIRSEYVSNKYYSGLYAHMGSNEVVNTIISFLAGPFLYSIGISLPIIFLFYCLIQITNVIGLLGSPFLVNKFGYNRTIILSYIFSGLFLVSIILSAQSLVFIFLASIFQGIQKSFYYPIVDTLQASFIAKNNRGKQISLRYILVSLAGALTAFAAGWLLSYKMNFILLTIAFIFVIVSVLPLYVIFKQRIETNIKNPKDIFSLLKLKKFRKRLWQTMGLAMTNTILTTVLSLYVFIYFKDFKVFGLVLVGAALSEMLVGLYFGRLIDDGGRKKGLKLSSLLVGIGSLLLVFFNALAWAISALKIYIQGVFNFLLNSYDANYNDKAKESGQPYLFSSSVLMIMSITGALLYGLCALLSCFLSIKILFSFIFFLSFIGLVVNFKFFEE